MDAALAAEHVLEGKKVELRQAMVRKPDQNPHFPSNENDEIQR